MLWILLGVGAARANEGGPVSVPSIQDGIQVEQSRGECFGIWQNHDNSFEAAYGWNFDAVADPYYGAFAESFEGPGTVCGIQFWLTQLGNQNGQTMDVIVWDDDNTGNPGPVLQLLPGIDPGAVAQWPDVSLHALDSEILVPEGKFWVGYWGDWAGSQAGWFVAADENGTGGTPRTNIAPDLGYPAGWESPTIVLPWEDCRSLGIQIDFAVDPASTDSPELASPLPSLERLSPNPFRSRVEVEYQVSQRGPVSLSVHDAGGRLIASLEQSVREPGRYKAEWNGRTADGNEADAGVYFVRMTQNGASAGKRLVRVR